MIYSVTGDTHRAIEFFQGIRRDSDGNIIEFMDMYSLAPDYVKRVVGTSNDFREKLLIFDAGLDDKVVEIMKITMETVILDNNKDISIDEFLFLYRKNSLIKAIALIRLLSLLKMDLFLRKPRITTMWN